MLKIKDINKTIAEMQKMEVGTEQYTIRWEILLEQYEHLIKSLSRNTMAQDKDDEYSFCVIQLPHIIEDYDASKAQFSTFLVTRLRGCLQRYRNNNHVIAKPSDTQKAYRKKHGLITFETQIISPHMTTGENVYNIFDGVIGKSSVFKNLKRIPAQQEDQLLYDDLLNIIKKFREADLFIDYYINERTADELCVERHISPTTFKYKMMQMKNKLKNIVEASQNIKLTTSGLKYKEWLIKLGPKKIEEIENCFKKKNMTEISKKYKIPYRTISYIRKKMEKRNE